jgi:hypothetical protein
MISLGKSGSDRFFLARNNIHRSFFLIHHINKIIAGKNCFVTWKLL